MNEAATANETTDAVEPAGKTEQAMKIVKNHVYVAGGVGFIGAPGVDMFGQTAVQLDMISRLAKLYDVPFRKDWGKATIAALLGGALPVMLKQPVGSLLKMIPVVGQTIGGLSMVVNGAAATYAVGRVFVHHFELGGNMLNFDADAMRSHVIDHIEDYKAQQAA